MKKPIIIHPYLLALYPILFLYSYNIHLLYPIVVVRPLLVTLLITLLLWALVNLAVKNIAKSAALVSVFLLLFFSYKHYLLTLIGIFHKGFLTRDEFLFPIWLVMCSLIMFLIFKIKGDAKNLTLCLNITAITLISFPAFSITSYEMTKRYPFNHRSELIKSFTNNEENNITASTKLGNKTPDIYYIIFDRYANSNILKEYFNYDNSDFINFLRTKGFYVATDSRANYPRTYLSVASSLNLDYLDLIKEKVGIHSNDETVVYDLLKDYKVWHFLKARGYQFIHLGGRWQPTKINSFANMNFNSFKIDDFTAKLLKNTLLLRIMDRYMDESQRDHILYQFNQLQELPKIKGPKFVFAHVLLPHEPFIFGPNGENAKQGKYKKLSMQEKYLNQLTFANKKIKTLADTLIAKSDTPPILLFQSDEGPYIHKDFKGDRGPQIYDWKGLSKDALRVHIMILNSYYLPGVDKSILYNSITPVNTFRVVFNSYFGTNYKLLKDESYIFEDSAHPYTFLNVTDVVK